MAILSLLYRWCRPQFRDALANNDKTYNMIMRLIANHFSVVLTTLLPSLGSSLNGISVEIRTSLETCHNFLAIRFLRRSWTSIILGSGVNPFWGVGWGRSSQSPGAKVFFCVANKHTPTHKTQTYVHIQKSITNKRNSLGRYPSDCTFSIILKKNISLE